MKARFPVGNIPGDKKFTDRKDDANDRLLQTCANMKAKDKGIQIYTIAFKAPTYAGQILRSCATRTDMAFTASSKTGTGRCLQDHRCEHLGPADYRVGKRRPPHD